MLLHCFNEFMPQPPHLFSERHVPHARLRSFYFLSSDHFNTCPDRKKIKKLAPDKFKSEIQSLMHRNQEDWALKPSDDRSGFELNVRDSRL